VIADFFVEMTMNPGESIKGRYKIVEMLGQGGHGNVYRVFDQGKNREVALKILDAQAASDSESMKRFINSGEVLSTIRHRAVVQFYSLELEGRVPFLVMEFIKGKSMALSKDELRKDLPTLFHHFVELLEGIQACHIRQVIHRDIQPSNLIIDPEGQLKIIDFGFAKTRENITKPGAILGNSFYLSPEQCKGLKITESADIYSIGMVFWEFLTGKLPFELDQSKPAKLLQLLEQFDKPFPIERFDEFPQFAPLRETIRLMLQKEAEPRPSIAQIIATLKREIPGILAFNSR